jgi:hypothetical protein
VVASGIFFHETGTWNHTGSVSVVSGCSTCLLKTAIDIQGTVHWLQDGPLEVNCLMCTGPCSCFSLLA